MTTIGHPTGLPPTGNYNIIIIIIIIMIIIIIIHSPTTSSTSGPSNQTKYTDSHIKSHVVT